MNVDPLYLVYGTIVITFGYYMFRVWLTDKHERERRARSH